VTSGKALIYPEVPRFLRVMTTVTGRTPKV
jgi:hypothetical protein